MSELNLLQRLNDFRKKVGAVKKDGNNPHFKAKYATIESVLATIESPLNECGIGYYQTFKKCEGEDYLCTTVFNVDKTEEIIENIIPLFLPSKDMQKLGSAITYARRYGLVSVFGLEQEDDDGNKAMPKTAPQPQKTQDKKSPNYDLKGGGDDCKCGGLIEVKKSKADKEYWVCGSCRDYGFNIKDK